VSYISIVAAIAVMSCSAASALTRPYAIEPVKAAWSGWTHRYEAVGQTVVCCWDELDSASGGYVELFCGYHEGNGRYNLDIKDYQTELTAA